MSDGGMVRILGIAGSLRRGSFNAATLRVAQELAPAGMTIEHFDIAPIPLYNEDVRQQGFPPPVEDLRARIKAADGLLIVTPEYNYSIPGVLKNAIDWASRPPEQPFDGKPIGIMGASGGALGTARAQSPLAAMLRVPERAHHEPPRGDDRRRVRKVRRRGQTHRSGNARVRHRAPHCLQGLGAAPERLAQRLMVFAVRHHVGGRCHAVRQVEERHGLRQVEDVLL